MRGVHENFSGMPGTIARFGDSIFISQAFFAPLQYEIENTTPRDDAALTWIRRYVRRSVWGWQNPQTGSAGNTTSGWPLEVEQNPRLRNIDHWLQNLNPEMAVIMWGTNDVFRQTSLDEYVNNMRDVLRTVKQNGTIPILTTIPPINEYEHESALIAAELRKLAEQECVPLMDYNQEIVTRNPGDTWNGALVNSNGQIFQVERLVAGDGVHPSNPTPYRSNFSEEALNKNGYTLLNHMTLQATYGVNLHVFTLLQRADVNSDGTTNVADIDLLASAIRAGQHADKYDLDWNGKVDSDDRSYLVNVAFRSFMGDSNLDGEFNSGDLISVFKVGEYEDRRAGNSGWSDGDWNGDGDFESGDFVHVFKTAAYEKGPRVAAATVPEPVGLWPVFAIGLFIHRFGRGVTRAN